MASDRAVENPVSVGRRPCLGGARKHAAAKLRRSTHIVTGEGMNPLAECIAANNTGDTRGIGRKTSTRYWK
jgi:hypothetical protein